MKTASTAKLFCLLVTLSGICHAQGKTENVVLITFDGARTQEVFGGLDLDILKDKTRRGNVEDSALYKKYWAEKDPDAP